jgi:glucosamine-6-phosphate deaminase
MENFMVQPSRTMRVEQLEVQIYPNNEAMGAAAAEQAVEILKAAIAARGQANLVLATGNSQNSFHQALRKLDGVDWSKVTVFHMDEYAGMKADHPASFRRFLHERIVDYVQPAAFYSVAGDAPDWEAECGRYTDLLKAHPVDLCCLGIGENGHIAFNDPPFADFDDPAWVKVVRLDDKSRKQQVGEGHFPTLNDVPTHALTLTIPALLSARRMICIVPEARKAEAVKAALTGPLTEDCPASILRQAAHCRLLLDPQAAALI